jgi:hypothetical protein
LASRAARRHRAAAAALSDEGKVKEEKVGEQINIKVKDQARRAARGAAWRVPTLCSFRRVALRAAR